MMQKTLTYSGFVAASLVVVLLFVTATNYTQLGLAIALYPFVAFAAFKVISNKSWRAPVISIEMPETKKASRAENNTSTDKVEVTDFDKRAFLKIIAGSGISFFIFSLLNRATGLSLFGGGGGTSGQVAEMVALKDSNNNKISPAEKNPTDGYRISEIDDNIITYYGFTNKDGAWFIMKEDTDTGSFRYANGDFNFNQGWNNREHLNYDYYNNVF